MLAAISLLIGLSCLIPLAALLANLRMKQNILRLDEVHANALQSWPKLSLIIPACNEEPTIRPALASLRALDYPNLEVVLIDDRSTDATGEIMDRVAHEDPRFRVIHNAVLPEGWLGKVHALKLGTAAASGEIILFTDADVVFAPDALKKTVALLEEKRLDHLCVIPDLQSKSFLASTVIASAMRTIALSQRPWHVEDPKRKEALGSGGFNMVRRSAFEKTEGFEWLKLEVADDIGLGHMMKLSGGKPGVLLGSGMVNVEWYPDFSSAVRGLEKNAFAQIARFSVVRGLGMSLVVTVVTLAPFLALVLPVPGLWIAGAIAIASLLASTVLLSRWTGHAIAPMVASAPFGDLILVFIVVRAVLLGVRRGGLIWRGTVYPTAALRAGMKVKF